MKFTASLICTLLIAGAALGQAAPPPQAAEARALFERGVQSANRGDLYDALTDFEAAYALQPHYSVLYNIGQARSALGKPVEAVAAFEQYLTEGGSRIDGARRDEVRGLIEASRRRIGSLHIVLTSPERSRVWLDGVELTKEKLGQPIALAVGSHQLLHVIASGTPEARVIAVPSTETVEVRLDAPAVPPQPAELAIACDPNVDVAIDGTPKARTSLNKTLSLEAGQHVVRFSRAGYHALSRSIEVMPGQLISMDCQLRKIDVLEPRDEKRQKLATASRERTIAYVLGGTGLGMLVAGVSLSIGNEARFEDWQRGRDSHSEQQNLDRATSIQQADDIALGLVVTGVALGLTGTWLFFDSANP